MRHPFENYLITRDNYLKNPYDVIEIANTLQYNRNPVFPGARTDNLLTSSDHEVKRFAEWFSNELSYNVFPGISMYELFLCFHVNDVSNDASLNVGWVHNDWGNLAGLIYLTPGEAHINTGTSIFLGEKQDSELLKEMPDDALARELFYMQHKITSEFRQGFERNQKLFEGKETIRVGNNFNRLVAYDSKMWHRPNSYSTSINKPRLSLLFFISQFQFDNKN